MLFVVTSVAFEHEFVAGSLFLGNVMGGCSVMVVINLAADRTCFA